MRHLLIAACGCALVALPAARGADKEATYLDLQPVANQALDDNFHDGRAGNNLAELPRDEQTFDGTRFRVGKSLIQLAGQLLKDKPEKVEGIKVDKPFTRLHILHATGYGGGPNKDGSALFVEDDTVIGQYTVRYEDKSEAIIEISYGKDVRDWWFAPGSEKGVSRGQVVWTGDNELAKQYDMRLRLYQTTWKNPNPAKKVVAIDYSSTNQTAAAPFCVAMTIERE